MSRALALGAALALWAALLPAWARADADASAGAVRRFALIASSNDGGKERVPLRFADSDAAAMAGVLRHLGGVRGEDVVLLPQATRARLEAAFTDLGESIARSQAGSARRELFVYYSGHSDEIGLLLGGELVRYREMRQWVDATGADVRIAVLDSCASGAVIRERGGTRRPPFLSDLSVNARGHAFLTASSADEAAQESDRIQGGFFTHYFLSGLRGAADASRDGRVTLAEAYQFSYNETLRRTEQGGGRPQHPAYDIQLAGTGDLVLTDLRSTTASLVLEEKLSGRVYVRDGAGRLMVELQKEPLYPVQLGLGPGDYRVSLETAGGNYRAQVALQEGRTVRLGDDQFEPMRTEPRAARGVAATSVSPPGEAAEPRARASTALFDTDLSFGAYAGVSFRYSRLSEQDSLIAGAELSLLMNHRLAIGVSGFGADPEPGRSMSFGYGGVIVRYHFLFDSPFYVSVAALTAAGAIAETIAGEDQKDSVFVFEPQLSGHLNVTPWLRFGVDAGYRSVAGAQRFDARDFAGPMGGFHAQLGWF
jgi:hypothetical protein